MTRNSPKEFILFIYQKFILRFGVSFKSGLDFRQHGAQRVKVNMFFIGALALSAPIDFQAECSSEKQLSCKFIICTIQLPNTQIKFK